VYPAEQGIKVIKAVHNKLILIFCTLVHLFSAGASLAMNLRALPADRVESTLTESFGFLICLFFASAV
jgi:hypothetical protein